VKEIGVAKERDLSADTSFALRIFISVSVAILSDANHEHVVKIIVDRS